MTVVATEVAARWSHHRRLTCRRALSGSHHETATARHRRQSLPMVASLGVVMVSCLAFRRSGLRAVIDLA